MVGADYFIEPLPRIVPLTDDESGQVAEGDDLDLTDGSKLFVFGYDEVRATLALD